uniref:Coat protein n=1 Tax=Rhizoctonia solani phlegivirus 7 TaxID=3162551 RepID=A0AAU6NDZ3_9VIRU
MFGGADNVAAGIGVANTPARWFNPTTPGTSGATILFNTSLVGFANYPTLVRGNSRDGNTILARDFRAVLANYHKPMMSLTTPFHARAVAAAVSPIIPEYHCGFLNYHDFAIPPLMLISSSTLPAPLLTQNEALTRQPAGGGASTGMQPSALSNPQSWFDAISFLLHHFGGRDAFAIGCQNAFRRAGLHQSPAVTEMPTTHDERFRVLFHENVEEVLGRRLAAMRFMQPRYSGNAVNQVAGAEWNAFTRMMLAVPYSGLTIDSPMAQTNTQPGHAASLAVLQRYFPQMTAGNARHGFTDVGTVNHVGGGWANYHVDATWHQFFASVDLGDESALRSFLRQMHGYMLVNLRLWLQDGAFHNRWDFDAALQNNRVRLEPDDADWVISSNRYGGGAHADWDARETFERTFGAMRFNLGLPATGLVESTDVTVPSGLAALRSLRIAHDMYHSDNGALVLAEEFLLMSADRFFKRFVLYSTQIRACADVAAVSAGLNYASIVKRTGHYFSGNRTLDRLLFNSTERESLGGMGDLLHSYTKQLSDLVLGTGVSFSLGADIASGYNKARFYIHTPWQPGPQIGTDAGSNNLFAHLVWRCLHPLVVQAFIPGAVTVATNVSSDLDPLYNISGRNFLPWTDWAINSAAFLPEEIFAALRVALMSVGQTVPVRFRMAYGAENTQLRPDIYNICTDLDRMTPRLADSFPFAPTAAVDPILEVQFNYAVNIDGVRDGDHYRYLDSVYNFTYVNVPRANVVAPMLTGFASGVYAGTARPDIVFATAVGDHVFNPLHHEYVADLTLYAGQTWNVGRPKLQGNATLTVDYDLTKTWHSNQETGNIERTRGRAAAFEEYTNGPNRVDPRSTGHPSFTADAEIVDRAGNVRTAASHALAAGRRHTCVVSLVPKGYRPTDLVPENDTQAHDYRSAVRRAIAKLGVLRLKASVVRPIVLMGGRTEPKVAQHTGIYQPFAQGQGTYEIAMSGLAEVVDVQIPYDDRNKKASELVHVGSQLVSAPADTYDMRHLRPAIPVGASSLDYVGPAPRHLPANPSNTTIDGFAEVNLAYRSGSGSTAHLRNRRLHVLPLPAAASANTPNPPPSTSNKASSSKASSSRATTVKSGSTAKSVSSSVAAAMTAEIAKLRLQLEEEKKRNQAPAGKNAIQGRSLGAAAPHF